MYPSFYLTKSLFISWGKMLMHTDSHMLFLPIFHQFSHRLDKPEGKVALSVRQGEVQQWS
jgi:Mlc titration factor MtfA (ptsG expression regulator)